MESIDAYQDILSRAPCDRGGDWMADRTQTYRRDYEVILTLHHWQWVPPVAHV